MRTKSLVVSVCVAVSLVATSASALLVPKKAKQLKGEFVAAYTKCDNPTTSGSGLAFPACPAYPADTCRFGPDGSGKYQLKAVSSGTTLDIKAQAKLSGLSGCEGAQLYFTPELRLTTEQCASGSECTVVDLPAVIPFGVCVVSQGRCDIKATAESVIAYDWITSGGYSFELGRICVVTDSVKDVACGGMRVGIPAFVGVAPTPVPTPTSTLTATPTPTVTATPNQKRVFVTSLTYQGSLSGLGGADSKCQARAAAASLPGTYKAWLSTAGTSAASRLTQSTLDYKRVDGVVVANGWSDLTDGSLDAPIMRDEFGFSVSDEVWTNATINGSIGAAECGGWNSNNPAFAGQPGDSTATDSTWTFKYNYAPCDQFKRLYCLEQ